jgi:hypothetical protein
LQNLLQKLGLLRLIFAARKVQPNDDSKAVAEFENFAMAC